MKTRSESSPRDFIDMYLNEMESEKLKGVTNSPFTGE